MSENFSAEICRGHLDDDDVVDEGEHGDGVGHWRQGECVQSLPTYILGFLDGDILTVCHLDADKKSEV
jgi:hypothetical protein